MEAAPTSTAESGRLDAHVAEAVRQRLRHNREGAVVPGRYRHLYLAAGAHARRCERPRGAVLRGPLDGRPACRRFAIEADDSRRILTGDGAGAVIGDRCPGLGQVDQLIVVGVVVIGDAGQFHVGDVDGDPYRGCAAAGESGRHVDGVGVPLALVIEGRSLGDADLSRLRIDGEQRGIDAAEAVGHRLALGDPSQDRCADPVSGQCVLRHAAGGAGALDEHRGCGDGRYAPTAAAAGTVTAAAVTAAATTAAAVTTAAAAAAAAATAAATTAAATTAAATTAAATSAAAGRTASSLSARDRPCSLGRTVFTGAPVLVGDGGPQVVAPVSFDRRVGVGRCAGDVGPCRCPIRRLLPLPGLVLDPAVAVRQGGCLRHPDPRRPG